MAMFKLYEAGLEPAAITRRCRAGTAGVEAFEIPRRSCWEIVHAIEREGGQEAPSRLSDIEDPEAVGRFPARALLIINAEMDRLERKQRRSGLTLNDIQKLERITKLSASIQRRLEGLSRSQRATQRRRRTERQSESLIERLARDLASGKESVEGQSSHTHARPEPPKPAPQSEATGKA
jgi:hypothetical protein